MNAEVIAVGSELTAGAKLDTNSQWLSVELAAVGIPVRYHSAVSDDMEAMLGVLRSAAARSDLVLVTGGLGPTLDDLTREALAAIMQVELTLHAPTLAFIQSLFEKRGYTMPARNRVQAMFPTGSEPLKNPRGTAPGIWAEIPRDTSAIPCTVAAMPGVPHEMKRMFHREVLPRLPGGANVIRRARVNCFGVGESTAEEMLGELTARGRDPEVGITVHEATITLRITAHGESAEECEEKISVTDRAIREIMGDLVFGVEDEELEHVVVRLLKEGGLTLATAESGTGGLLAHRLTEVDGFESCFLGGVIAPTEAAKQVLLDVKREVVEAHGSVSAEIAKEMAAGCRQRFGSDFALAVSECPRFDQDDPHAAVPTAYVALVGDGLSKVREHALLGDLALVKSRAAKIALNLLRLQLMR